MNNLKRLDGRHKLAVMGALVCWGLSMYFSKEGFSVGNTVMLWVGWVLAGIVTVVELVFNSPTQKLSLTLIVVGILCYVYGIWTNVTGFWELQHPQVEFVIFSTQSLLSWFVGFIIEVLPEPLFMWGIAAAFDGDFLGNLAGLWNGKLPYAQAGNENKKWTYPPVNDNKGKFNNPQKSQYNPQHKPNNNPMPPMFRSGNNQPKPKQNQPFPHKMGQMPTNHPIAIQGRPDMEDTDKDF